MAKRGQNYKCYHPFLPKDLLVDMQSKLCNMKHNMITTCIHKLCAMKPSYDKETSKRKNKHGNKPVSCGTETLYRKAT